MWGMKMASENNNNKINRHVNEVPSDTLKLLI